MDNLNLGFCGGEENKMLPSISTSSGLQLQSMMFLSLLFLIIILLVIYGIGGLGFWNFAMCDPIIERPKDGKKIAHKLGWGKLFYLINKESS